MEKVPECLVPLVELGGFWMLKLRGIGVWGRSSNQALGSGEQCREEGNTGLWGLSAREIRQGAGAWDAPL